MKRSYWSELAQLSATAARVAAMDARSLVDPFARSANTPLIAVGSGGSLVAANVAAQGHRVVTQHSSMAVTPMEFAALEESVSSSTVAIFSSGGRNPDALGTLERALGMDARHVVVLCARDGSPLRSLAERYPDVVDFIRVPTATAKDGFLATNSLVGTLCVLWRVFGLADHPAFESDVTSIVRDAIERLTVGGPIESECAPLWNTDSLFVLHDETVRAAAVDLETRFTEAALAHVVRSDYRNFAHGRHHWIDRRRDATVLALSTHATNELALKTLALLPHDVATVHIPIPGDGLSAAISGVLVSLYISGWVGDHRGNDIGRPHIAEFGRRIYHLNTLRAPGMLSIMTERRAQLAVERKMRVLRSRDGSLRNLLRENLQRFQMRLTTTEFHLLVLDYDETLCSHSRRYLGLSTEIVAELRRLVLSGGPVAVVSGRGKSVREELRKALPEGTWGEVIVGYYNGAVVARLSQDDALTGDMDPNPTLGRLYRALMRADEGVGQLVLKLRPLQLSVETKKGADPLWLWAFVSAVSTAEAIGDVAISSSGHAVDVTIAKSSKTSIMRELGVGAADTLAVGDQGAWPGNDYSLLEATSSLSVDQVSMSLTTCWNVSPAGVRGASAAVAYLKSMQGCPGVITVQSGILPI